MKLWITVAMLKGVVYEVVPFKEESKADIHVTAWEADNNVRDEDERDCLAGIGTEITKHEVEI